MPGSVSCVRSDQELQWPPDNVSPDTRRTTDNSTQLNVETTRHVVWDRVLACFMLNRYIDFDEPDISGCPMGNL